VVTDSENQGTIATCSRAVSALPVSAPCHLSISSRVNRIASDSEVMSDLAVSPPTVWMQLMIAPLHAHAPDESVKPSAMISATVSGQHCRADPSEPREAP
jgi:hypothetical protein